VSGCGSPDGDDPKLRILSGAENASLEPMIQSFASEADLDIEITYMGSVDIMRELRRGADSSYDAVWPANRMWIDLGDTEGVIQLSASILRSPVVLGVKRSSAERLGWIGSTVTVDDILAAAEAGALTFMMSNAAQSDSGASAYLGFLYAFAGHPDLLTAEHLQDPMVRDKIQRLFGTVGRSAGSSALLNDLFLQDYDAYDGMFNYESVIIETNRSLVQQGREPLYAIYPFDGTALADSPLALIDKDHDAKQAAFAQLQSHLLSDHIQKQLVKLGRRAGPGINPTDTDPTVFNPDWGIDPLRILNPIKIPDAPVVTEALNLYQSLLRKPSFTVFALDFSGSMKGDGEQQVTEAMRLILDQSTAEQYLLQASPNDITIVITFSNNVKNVWQVEGADPNSLIKLADDIEREGAGGGTDIYKPVIRGFEMMKERGITGYFPAVVLLTDGKSSGNPEDLTNFLSTSGLGPVPVFAITFGDASRGELEEIAMATSGAVFDGHDDLVAAFRAVKINN
jgi:Ca-activated chloride channel family protein